MVWVRFHEELTLGAKRGIPRALRFVLMELSLKARPLGGEIELPCGMSDVDAVHDLLGGDRVEIEEALRRFTSGRDPVLSYRDEDDRRFLLIPSWAKWNPGGEAPGASTARSRKHRSTKVAQESATTEQRAGNAAATPVALPLQPTCNADATLTRGEEREKREDQIPPVCVDPGPGNNARAETPTHTHTHTGPVRAARDPDADMPRIVTAEDMLAAFREQPVLRRLAGYPAVAENLAATLQVRGAPPELARKACSEFALKHPIGTEKLQPEDLARLLGGYLASAKLFAASTSGAREEPIDPQARHALTDFDAAWARAHGGRTRAHDDRDFEHAAKVLSQAKEASARSGGRATPAEVLRHVFAGYQRDGDRFLADAEHPLRLLPGRFSSYGMPERSCAPSARPVPAEPPPRARPPLAPAGGSAVNREAVAS